MMKLKFLLYGMIIFMVMGRGNSQELPLTHFTSVSEVNPLPSALVTQVYQDREGFIWYSNFSSGVVRHDGVGMDLYDQDDGLRDHNVWQLIEDANGYLWVSSNSGLVVSEEPLPAYRNGKRVHFTSTVGEISLAAEAISHNQQMAVDGDGKVYIATAANGILSYEISKWPHIEVDTLFTNFGGKDNLNVTSLVTGPSGKVIAALEGGKLASFQNGKAAIFYNPAEAREEEDFYSIFEDNSGKIWAYNQNGKIFLFRAQHMDPEIIYEGVPSNINRLNPISNGEIFANNGEAGIIRIDGNSGKVKGTYTRKNGLLSNNVYSVLEDREGNIWIAQSGGVSKLRYNYRAFESYTARSVMGETPVLSSGSVNAVFLPHKDSIPGRFWIGTEEGVTVVNEKGESQFIRQTDGLVSDWVNGITSDAQGRVWIATTQGVNGIIFKEGKYPGTSSASSEIEIFGKPARIVELKESPPSIASENLVFYSQKNNKPIISSWFPGVRSVFGVRGEEAFGFNPEFGLPPTIYHAVAVDNEGRIWVGTRDKGLFRSKGRVNIENLTEMKLKEGQDPFFEQVWSVDNGAPGNQIEKLLFHDGKIWIGTPEGLYAMGVEDQKIKTAITADDGMPWSNAVSFALSPVSGNLWVGTNGGLAEVDPSSGKVIRTVTRHDGLVDNEVWLYGSVKINEEGEVFYGTSEGITIYNPELDVPNKVPPVLHLDLADISYKSDSRNEAAFEYVALSFANVPEVKYRTRLLGYDSKWSEPTSERKIRFTNLSAYLWPKEYTLEIMAENGSGVFSEAPLQYKFEVEPVWWLKWWAFLGYLIIFTTLILIVDRVQRARLIKRERDRSKLYEAQLKAETATARSNAAEAQAKALQAENEKKEVELEKAHQLQKAYDELKAAQNQVVQAEKMASLGRLATGIAHEIKNPLNFINNFAELSSELVGELMEAWKKGSSDIDDIMRDLKQNTIKIEEHGKRADAIVRSMMQHARGGKSTFEDLDINELIEKYAALAYHGKCAQNPDFQASLRKDLDSDMGPVGIMGQEIGQVLLNLIGNSLDAVWEKKLRAGEGYDPEVVISTRQEGEHVEIRVSDNGPGIPKDNHEKIFEPFFTTKPTGEGTGLGLSLSYTIITQGHSGSLRLIEDKEEGATFVITLPLSKGQEKEKVARGSQQL